MPRSNAARKPSSVGEKKSLGVVEDAADSGLNPLRNIQNTGKKKMRTSAQVSTVTKLPLVLLVIGNLLP